MDTVAIRSLDDFDLFIDQIEARLLKRFETDALVDGADLDWLDAETAEFRAACAAERTRTLAEARYLLREWLAVQAARTSAAAVDPSAASQSVLE